MSKAKSKAGEAPAVETNGAPVAEVQAAQEQAVAVVTEAAETESSPVSKTAEDDPKVDDPAAQDPQEPLDTFLRRVEGKHIDRDVVATAATHPHASEITWPGTYGGIRLSAGPVSVTYSDGTTE